MDKSDIGRRFAPVRAVVRPDRLQAFLRATGETNPIYWPDASAESVTGRCTPIPPTYLFCLEMIHAERPFGVVEDLGIDLASILHGEQSFRYLAPVNTGDAVTFETRVVDVFERRNGALTFVIQETDVTDQDGRRVAELRRTIIIQNHGVVS